MTSETPRFAGSYRIESVLGRGAMATVHLAHHTRIPDIQVAIKIVDNTHPEAEMLLARFEREAQILASVSHHHLVRIHDFGKIGRSFYIAMDYIRGCDLRDLINQHISSEQHFDPLLIIKILKEVCVALKVTHDRGIIHRDLKPENIMLEKTALDPYFVRVLDFGIAKMLDSVEDNPKRFQTMAGIVCGTAEYMSPEQAKGSPLDGRSDLYALGCLLYEMLSLQLPFSAENPVAYLTQHIAEPPFPLDIRAPNSNLYLRRLAHFLLSKNPDDRPDTALEVYEALMDIEDEIRVEDARKRSPRRNSKIMRIYTPPPTPAVTSLAGLASEVSIPVGIAVDEADPHHANTDEIRITTSPIQRFLRNRLAVGGLSVCLLMFVIIGFITPNKEKLIDLSVFLEPIATSRAQPSPMRIVQAQTADEIPISFPRRSITDELPTPPIIETRIAVYARLELENETRHERFPIISDLTPTVVVVKKVEPTPAQKLAKAKILTKQAVSRKRGCTELQRLFSSPVKKEAQAHYNVYCTE